ncbi:MAG: hypothetical protein JST92_08760 [Deltaproteobacteria bacterium]|nr:hypothetical protein [Deltaproteobacteria bacterium]
MSYASERLELFQKLREQLGGRAPAEAFRLDGRSLRFHLGTSLADLRVPVATDEGLADAFGAAALDLLFLLCARHRTLLRESEWDQLLLHDGFDPKALKPVSHASPVSVSREGIRRAFLEAPELHPSLDTGIVAVWIASSRPGRTLVGAVNALLRRALEESARSDKNEPTPYLVLLALRRLFEGAMGALKKVPIGQQTARPLHGAVAAGLLLSLRLAAREAVAAVGAPIGPLAEACIAPLVQLGGTRHLVGSLLTCHGVAFSEVPPRIDGQAQRLATGASVDSVWRELGQDLTASKDLSARAERSGALAAVRAELLVVLRLIEAGKAPSVPLEGTTLWQLHGTPGVLEKVLATPDRRKDLMNSAKAAAKACTTEAARDRIEALALIAKEWTEDKPSAGWMRQAEAQKAWVTAACALSIDVALDRLLAQAERSIVHRSGQESEDGLEPEHELGRLYLLTLADKPILRSRSKTPPMGHLFCDVKDFTKRTAFLKEAVVADFLQREFYTPILTAAARHQHGAAHLGDKGGIYLNNLLGDAVSFSGDVAALVELAHEIRAALQSYAARLESESSREAVARTIAEIEARCSERRAHIESQLATAQKALAKGTLDPESGEEPGTRIRSLQGELQRLEDEREGELSLVRGEKLEAGIFISYGSAPEVSTFEDAVFGAIKVSIAEKINESARGTARNGGVKARVDTLLSTTKAQRGRELVCPFTVFLSQPLSIPIPPELETVVRAALDEGDSEGAELALAESVRSFVRRLASQGMQTAGGDIYNGGAAMSEEALEAYIEQRGDDFMVVRREIGSLMLHPSLLEKFVFPQSQLSVVCLVASASQALHELFVFQGRALFKGLEKQGGLGVFELIPAESEFFSLLAKHHVPQWIREVEETGGQELDGWRPTPYMGVQKLES